MSTGPKINLSAMINKNKAADEVKNTDTENNTPEVEKIEEKETKKDSSPKISL